MINPIKFIRDMKNSTPYCSICNSHYEDTIEAHAEKDFHARALKIHFPTVKYLNNDRYYCSRCKCNLYGSFDVRCHKFEYRHEFGLRVIAWRSLKKYIYPFLLYDSADKDCECICLICDCALSNGRSNLERHVLANRHSYAIDRHGFWIVPLSTKCFYCICCDHVIDDYRHIYNHTREKTHCLNLYQRSCRKLSTVETIEWKDFPHEFVAPFISREANNEFYCTICDRTLTGETDFLAHLRDAKHAETVKLNEPHTRLMDNDYYRCDLCEIVVHRYKNYHLHLSRFSHVNMLANPVEAKTRRDHANSLTQLIVWTSNDNYIAPFIRRTKKDSNEFYCIICKQPITSISDLKIHQMGESHVELLNRDYDHVSPLSDYLYHCKLCDFIVSSWTMIEKHLWSIKHCDGLGRLKLVSNVTSATISTLPTNVDLPKIIDWTNHEYCIEPFVLQEDKEKFYCMLCNCTLGSNEARENHTKSKNHIFYFNRHILFFIPLEDDYYQCKVCHCVIGSYRHVYEHITTRTHKSKLESIDLSEIEGEKGNGKKKKYDTKKLTKSPELPKNLTKTPESPKKFKKALESSKKLTKTPESPKKLIKSSESPKKQDNCLVDRVTVTESRSYRIIEKKHQDGRNGRSLTYKKSIVKTNDRVKISKSMLNSWIEFDDAKLNFQLDRERWIDEEDIPSCEIEEWIEERTEQEIDERTEQEIDERRIEKIEERREEKIEERRVKNIDERREEKTEEMTDEKIEERRIEKIQERREENIEERRVENIEERRDDKIVESTDIPPEAILSLMKKELRTLYEQLRSKNSQNPESIISEAITEGRDNIFEKLALDQTAFNRLEYLMILTEFLSRNTINDDWTKDSLTITERQFTTRTLSGIPDDTTNATGVASFPKTPGQICCAESTDSGNEDSPQIASTTASTSMESSDAKTAITMRRSYAETEATLLDFKEDIYATRETTRITMLEGMKLRIAIDAKTDYCLICRAYVSNEIDKCIGHLVSHRHVEYLEIMEDNHRELETIEDEFSELSLAREYMGILSKDAVRCLVCRVDFRNNFQNLKRHIDETNHRRSHEKLATRAKKSIDLVSDEINCDWYKVQKYECTICVKTFDFEVDFVEHLLDNETRHKSLVNGENGLGNGTKMIYDFCALCALLWCANPNVANEHNVSASHLWFVRNGRFVMAEMPKSALELLANLEDCEDFVDDGIMEKIEENCRESIVRAHEKGTGHNGDSGFESEPPLEDVNFIKFFNTICPYAKKMMSFLNQWLINCDLSGTQGISMIAIYWYLILYLQGSKILPSIASLNSMKSFLHGLMDWKEFIMPERKGSGMKEHMIGFFALYANFDYRYDVACPLIGKVMEKRVYANDFPYLPEEMRSYASYLRGYMYPEPFRIDSVMCLQDPFDVQNNITRFVSKVELCRFRIFCSKSLDILCSTEET